MNNYLVRKYILFFFFFKGLKNLKSVQLVMNFTYNCFTDINITKCVFLAQSAGAVEIHRLHLCRGVRHPI